jgi:hypothetical protein
MGEQYVGIDLRRRRSVIVRMTPEGQVLETVRIDNDPVVLSLELAKAGGQYDKRTSPPGRREHPCLWSGPVNVRAYGASRTSSMHWC